MIPVKKKFNTSISNIQETKDLAQLMNETLHKI